jgi:anti-anti-sigma factor
MSSDISAKREQHDIPRLRVRMNKPGPRTAVCVVSGELDLATNECFRQLLQHCTCGRVNLLLDLTEVTHFSAGAVAILLDVQQTLAARHQVLELAASAQVARVLRLLDLDELIPGSDRAAYPAPDVARSA